MTIESYYQFLKWAFIFWMSGIVVLLVLLLRKYTFGKWDKDNPNPYQGESLAIPRGFFRSTIALSLLFTVILLQIGHLVFNFENAKIEGIMLGFQMMLAFYFGAKALHHLSSVDKQKYQALTESISKSSRTKEDEDDFEEEGSVG